MLSPHRNRAAKAPSVPTGPGFDTATPELDFAKKYTPDHAQYYFDKHESLGRRLSNWREIYMARRALKLAREPRTVLDIPCGTGRFWPLLAEMAGRKIYAADLNLAMIETAVRMQPPELVARVETFQTSAFSIPKPDGFVKTVFCIRLFHHIQDSAHRLQLLKELARVTSDTIIVSLWLDGNYKAWRWRSKNRRRPAHNRFVVARKVIEEEFVQSGLTVIARLNSLRFHSLWAMYVLQKQGVPVFSG